MVDLKTKISIALTYIMSGSAQFQRKDTMSTSVSGTGVSVESSRNGQDLANLASLINLVGS